MKTLVLMPDATYALQFDNARIEALRGLTTVTDPIQVGALDDPRVASQLASVQVVITSWGSPRLDEDSLRKVPNLVAVLHAAGSVRHLLDEAVWDREVVVSSSGALNAIPVAEYTFAMVVMVGKKVPFLAQDARSFRDDWSYRTQRGILSNVDCCVGVVGFSQIGRLVVERLANLANCTVLVADPYADPRAVSLAGAHLMPLDSLLPRVDTLSIHAPLLPATHHMIGARELAMLPERATVINTARGALVDTEALALECVAGRLNAVLDVTDPEPLPSDSVLYDLPNVMITPHVAGSLDTETRLLTDGVLEELRALEAGRPLAREIRREQLGTSA